MGATTDGEEVGDPAADRSTAWLVRLTAVLSLGMAVGTLSQFAFGALAPLLRTELDLSRTQLGAITTAFFVAGTLVSPFAGTWTDRVGGRRALAALFAVDTVAFVGMALAPGYWWLLAAVVVSGLAIAVSNPATNLLVAEHVSSSARGGVVGVKQSGVQVGSFLCGIALAPLGAAIGWRWSLVVLAGIAALGLLSCMGLPHGDPTARRAAPSGRSSREVLRWLAPYAFFMGAGIASVTAYVVLYAHEAMGYTEAAAGALLAVVGAVGFVARIVWSHYAERHGATAWPLIVMAGGAVVSTLAILAAPRLGGALLWLGAAGIGLTAAAWNGVGMLAVIRQVGTASSGRTSGFVMTSFYAGLLTMPVVFGVLVDRSGSYRSAWILTVAVFAAALLLILWRRAAADEHVAHTTTPPTTGA